MHSDDSTVLVPLTQGKVAIIDAEDAERVLAHKWTASRHRDRWYAYRKNKGRNIYLHRFIMDAPPGIQVDHADNDGLNCRRGNMRFATHSQNMANTPGRQGKSSGFRGVIFDGRYKKPWRAQASIDNHCTLIGTYDTTEEAARAYDDVARTRWGEFAVTNF